MDVRFPNTLHSTLAIVWLAWLSAQGRTCTVFSDASSYRGTVPGTARRPLIDWLIDWLASGFESLRSRRTWALVDGSFVPHIHLWEPCYFAKIPDAPPPSKLILLISSGSKKKEPRCACLSDARASRRPHVSRANIIVTVLLFTSMWMNPEQTLPKHAIIVVEHPIYTVHVACGTDSI